MKKFGFVAVAGRPNAGKSSLINLLIGEELCPVTTMPQTTRQVLRGILTEGRGQMVFVDTPGMHHGKFEINHAMAESIEKLLLSNDTDAVVYVVDVSRPFGEEESLIAHLAAKRAKNLLILFNKKDAVPAVDAVIKTFFASYPFLKEVPFLAVSALAPVHKDEILSRLFEMLPGGEPLFPEEDYTDANMRTLAAEIIRRQVILNSRDEVPHASAVLIEEWKDTSERALVNASILVETEGQKAILIGPQGKKIQQIKQWSKKDIAKITGMPVTLSLFVKVRPGWRDNPAFLRELGLLAPKKK